ncbi:MAG: hypothetical protein MN733_03940, partial [Nitrososphaera sp.]|nr:hypothetical protein [Nitrososphaera sp.]
GGSMLRRLSDFQTEGTQAQGDFQQQIAQGLLELQEATRTGSRDLRQQLADLESERGVLGSQ